MPYSSSLGNGAQLRCSAPLDIPTAGNDDGVHRHRICGPPSSFTRPAPTSAASLLQDRGWATHKRDAPPLGIDLHLGVRTRGRRHRVCGPRTPLSSVQASSLVPTTPRPRTSCLFYLQPRGGVAQKLAAPPSKLHGPLGTWLRRRRAVNLWSAASRRLHPVRESRRRELLTTESSPLLLLQAI